MKIVNVVLLLAVLLMVPTCSHPAQPTNQPGATDPSQVQADAALSAQIAQIAGAAKGRVGVDAVLLETARSASLRGSERFPMQSVYKLPISMAILAQVDAGNLKLDQKVRVDESDFVTPGQRSPIRDQNPEGTELTLEQLIQFAVVESDGTASDVLMRLAGVTAIRDFLRQIEIDGIVIANTEKELAQNWQTQYLNSATPRAATKLLRALQEQQGLSTGSRALLVKFMIESTPGADRLKGLLPAGTVVAHKTGTSGTREGVTAATNDIGVITLPNGQHVAIAIFVADSPADLKTREEVIAKIARAVWDKWAK